MPQELVEQATLYGIQPLEFQPLVLDWPSISPFLGDTWWLETTDFTGGTTPPPDGQSSSSGLSVGAPEPNVAYDREGRPIVGQVVVVRYAQNNQFMLPQVPPGKAGFMLKVINNTNDRIQAIFPNVFTYYGSAVYGQPYPLGGLIAPGEAGLYRANYVGQGKVEWGWEGLSNRVIQ